MVLSIIKKRILLTYIIFSLAAMCFTGFWVFEIITNEGSASAEVIIVDCNGRGNHTTIQAAINSAKTGDTIYVWDGTYNENINVDKSVTLIGNGTTRTIIDGGNSGDVVNINSNWVNISGFTIRNSGSSTSPNEDSGIDAKDVNNIHIFENNFTGNLIGIYLDSVNNAIIENNSLYSNDMVGIYVFYSISNKINNNTVSQHKFTDIRIQYSSNCEFSNNAMQTLGFMIYGFNENYWNTHAIDTKNNLRGKPIYYWKNCNGGNVPDNAGQVILGSCTDVTVKDQNISNSYAAVQIGFSNNNNIINNNFTGNYYGIALQNSSNNIINNNSIRAPPQGQLTSIGLSIIQSDNNRINENTITGNDYGIYVMGIYSNDNRIYHNNFIGNNDQLYYVGNTNYWNEPYPIGGNYWSDYYGEDLNDDGIGDTNLPYKGSDNLPYIEPSGWEWPSTPT
jgi:parallel beta-helix repeat protein